jgi:hypothetical protein
LLLRSNSIQNKKYCIICVILFMIRWLYHSLIKMRFDASGQCLIGMMRMVVD